MFNTFYFKQDLPAQNQQALLDYFCRGFSKKKHNPYVDIFAVGSKKKNFRCVFQKFVVDNEAALVNVHNFSLAEHNAYERMLNNFTGIKDFNPNAYVKRTMALAAVPAAEAPDRESEFDEDEYVYYRQQTFKFLEGQTALIETMCHGLAYAYERPGKKIKHMIVGAAGTGKTLLAEKILIHLATEYPAEQLLYICPSVLLARQMQQALEEAKTGNVKCLALTELATAEHHYECFKAFKSGTHDRDAKKQYRALCESAVSEMFEQKENLDLERYKNHITATHTTELNLGLGFPLGLLRASMAVVIDEYQEVPIPLLVKLTNTAKHVITLGDPHQTLNSAGVKYQHRLAGMLGMQVEQVHELTQSCRSSSAAGVLAHNVLMFKLKEANARHIRRIAEPQATKHGSVFIVAKKELPPAKTIALSINSKVICLQERDTLSAQLIFGEASVSHVAEMHGLEFEHVFIYIPDNFNAVIDKKDEKNTLLFNALYTAITRATLNVALVVKNPDTLSPELLRGIASNNNIKELLHQCTGKVSQHECLNYIQQEINAGYLPQAEYLYRKFVSDNDGFFTYCLAHNISFTKEQQDTFKISGNLTFSDAVVNRLKTLCLWRYLTWVDLAFVFENAIQYQQPRSLMHALSVFANKMMTHKKEVPNHSQYNELMNYVMRIIIEQDYDEALKQQACFLLQQCADNLKYLQKVPDNVYSALHDLLITADAEATKGHAAAAFDSCLRYTRARPTDETMRAFYLALSGLICSTSAETVKGNATIAFACCLQCTQTRPTDETMRELYLALSGLICSTSAETVKRNATIAFAYCLQCTQTRPTDETMKDLYLALSGLIRNASAEAVKAHAAAAFSYCLQYTQARPRDETVRDLYLALSGLICSTSDEAVKGNAAMAFSFCLQYVQARPTDETVRDLYLALCGLIRSTSAEVTKMKALSAFMSCLQYTQARPTDETMRAFYPALCGLISGTSAEAVKGHAAMAFSYCLQYMQARPRDEVVSALYPVLCELIRSASAEIVKGNAAIAFSYCLQYMQARPRDETVRDLYPALCEIISGGSAEVVKGNAAVAFSHCLQYMQARPRDEVVSALYLALYEIISGRSAEVTKGNAAVTFSHCLQCTRVQPTDETMSALCLALCELIRSASAEVIRGRAASTFSLCLQQMQARPTDEAVSALYPALCEIISGRSAEVTKGNAASAFSSCLQYTQARPSDEAVSALYPALCELISGRSAEVTKGNVASAFSSCLQYTQARPRDEAVTALYPALCELIRSASDEDVKGNAAVAFSSCLQYTQTRPTDEAVSALYPALCEIISGRSAEVTKRNLAATFGSCLRYTQVRPADEAMEVFYPVLCELIETFQSIQDKVLFASVVYLCVDKEIQLDTLNRVLTVDNQAKRIALMTTFYQVLLDVNFSNQQEVIVLYQYLSRLE